MSKISLVNQFRICSGLELPEDFASTLGGYYGRIYLLFSRYRLQHEFQMTTEQSKNEFGSFIKNRLLETAYRMDLNTFEGKVTQSKVFKKAALPLLLKSKPYPGVFTNSFIV